MEQIHKAAEDKTEEILLFPTMIYRIGMPEFLDPIRKVAGRYLKKIAEQREVDEIYPMVQSWSFHNEPEAEVFGREVLRASWDILQKQGYFLQGVGTAFQAMWFQDHHKLSSMEKHTHGQPAQLVGFYFLEVPEEKTPWLVLDDPRPGKVQSEPLPRHSEQLQVAAQRVSFRPKAGELYLTPSWLPHSLTRNGSDKPFLLAHINVMLVPFQQPPQPVPEIL